MNRLEDGVIYFDCEERVVYTWDAYWEEWVADEDQSVYFDEFGRIVAERRTVSIRSRLRRVLSWLFRA